MLGHDKDQCKADMSDFYASPKQLFICFFNENKRFLERTIVEKMYDFIDNRCMKKDQEYVFFGVIACYCQFCTNLGAIPIGLYNSSVLFPQAQGLKTKGKPALTGQRAPGQVSPRHPRRRGRPELRTHRTCASYTQFPVSVVRLRMEYPEAHKVTYVCRRG